MKNIRKFFEYARKRHEIYLRRVDGVPREEWTQDEILQRYRFTNVFRELDKTTAWFRKYVRDPLRDRPEVLLATVVFRMFNRIEVGEAVFCQTDIEASSAFGLYLRDGNTKYLRRAIVALVPRGPYATGAYIISSPAGYSKLDGILRVVGMFARGTRPFPELRGAAAEFDWWAVADQLREPGISLEATWRWLREFDYLGNFHSYEIVTDLRHTGLLCSAPDVMTWCNIGPGARRGLNRVSGRDKSDHSLGTEGMLTEMREILQRSRDAVFWPQGGKRTAESARNDLDWPTWEMREVEHTLCEFDKYERVRLGEGRPRGVYR